MRDKFWNLFGSSPDERGAFAMGDGRGPRGRHGHGPGRHGHGHGHGPGSGHGPFGGPRGPFGGGGPFAGFFRSQRAKRGDVRAGILALLHEGPRNGYQIMQDLNERSGGHWRPSPGSVYPALQQLQDEGLVEAEAEGSGKRFSLTEAGKTYCTEHADEVKAPWEKMGGDDESPAMELFMQMKGLGAAVMQVAQAGSPEQMKQCLKLLGDAKKSVYRILAEDEPVAKK